MTPIFEKYDCPALRRARAFSTQSLSGLRADLAAVVATTSVPSSVAAAGSLGRLEAGPQSDVDCMILLDAPTDHAVVQPLADGVADVIVAHGFKRPKRDGIYCSPIPVCELLDESARGSLSESPRHFGTRIQMILDARYLVGEPGFDQVRREILRWYAASDCGHGAWAHLLNDLSRYLHSYAVWQQFKFSTTDDDSWYLRQVKLRSTRIMTFASLLFVLGRGASDVDWIEAQLKKTPVERVIETFEYYDDPSIDELVSGYDFTISKLASDAVRVELVDADAPRKGERYRNQTEVYAEIHDVTEQLMWLMTRFICRRVDDWMPSFLRNWIL